jgi:uncharacterized membrane protein
MNEIIFRVLAVFFVPIAQMFILIAVGLFSFRFLNKLADAFFDHAGKVEFASTFYESLYDTFSEAQKITFHFLIEPLVVMVAVWIGYHIASLNDMAAGLIITLIVLSTYLSVTDPDRLDRIMSITIKVSSSAALIGISLAAATNTSMTGILYVGSILFCWYLVMYMARSWQKAFIPEVKQKTVQKIETQAEKRKNEQVNTAQLTEKSGDDETLEDALERIINEPREHATDNNL